MEKLDITTLNLLRVYVIRLLQTFNHRSQGTHQPAIML